MHRLVYVAGAAVVSCNHQGPIAINLIEVSQELGGGIRRLDRVASFIDETIYFQAIAFSCSKHKLPQTGCPDSARRSGVECRLDDGKILQFQRNSVIVECFFEDGNIKIASTEHIGNRASQAAAILVDEALHNAVVGKLHHSRNALQAFLIYLRSKGGIVVGVLTSAVGTEICLCVPFHQQGIDVVGHTLG